MLLGQVSSLLNDIRGLVVEAANTGAMSNDQIEANQLQVDSSLEAINRIAQTTTFQGRRLLDGSLDFNTTANTVPTIRDLQIDQANLGSAGQVAVEVDISAAATVAESQQHRRLHCSQHGVRSISRSAPASRSKTTPPVHSCESTRWPLASDSGVDVDFVQGAVRRTSPTTVRPSR